MESKPQTQHIHVSVNTTTHKIYPREHTNPRKEIDPDQPNPPHTPKTHNYPTQQKVQGTKWTE